MKFRLQLLLVMIVSILTSSLSSFAYDFEVDGIYYNIISAADRTCEVTSGDVKYAGDIVIPSSVVYKNNTVSVIKIRQSTFRDCSSLTSIVIPNSITSIEDYTFYHCSSLTTIEIPNSIKGIRPYAFSECSSLTSIHIPESVTWIGDGAFSGCSSLTSIEIPNSVTSIGESAFEDCSSLTSIETPNSITSIEDYTFYHCSSLTTIEIPNSVNSIGKAAFSNCSSLTSIEIPNSVTSIGSSAFSNCTSLSKIQLSENLTRLEYCLFNDCTSLQSLTIPGSIRSIVFYQVSAIYHYKYPTFSSSIKSIRFDYSDEYLEPDYYNASNEMYGETSWYYDEEVTMFTNQIEKLYIDRNIRCKNNLGNFLSVKSLKELIIGEHINTIDIVAYEATNLSSITCFASIPPKSIGLTQSQYTDIILKVPYEALDAYKNAEGWKNFWNIEGFDPAGADDVTTGFSDPSNHKEVSRYTLNGQAVSEDYKGVVIVRFSDGTTKKIMQ